MVERESRSGEGSEIKRAAPGGTCASLSGRSAGARGGKGEVGARSRRGRPRSAGGGAAQRPSLLPSAAPGQPATSRRSPDPRSGSGRLVAPAAHRMWQRTRPRPRAPCLWALALLALGGAGLCHADPQPRHPARPSARNK